MLSGGATSALYLDAGAAGPGLVMVLTSQRDLHFVVTSSMALVLITLVLVLILVLIHVFILVALLVLVLAAIRVPVAALVIVAVIVVGSNRHYEGEAEDQSHENRNPIPLKSQPLHAFPLCHRNRCAGRERKVTLATTEAEVNAIRRGKMHRELRISSVRN